MRLASILLPLILIASPLSAEDASKRNGVVIEFIRAVGSGGSLSQFALEPALSEIELAAISSLSGCKAALAEGSHSHWIKFDWSCRSNPSVERQTALKFSEDRFESVWINPLPSQLVPTSIARNAEHLPSQQQISRQFASAVKVGEDPTLGGLVTIIPEHLQKLKSLVGLEYEIPSGNSKRSQALFWDVEGKVYRDSLVTSLEFDENGRPVGLILSSTSKLHGAH